MEVKLKNSKSFSRTLLKSKALCIYMVVVSPPASWEVIHQDIAIYSHIKMRIERLLLTGGAHGILGKCPVAMCPVGLYSRHPGLKPSHSLAESVQDILIGSTTTRMESQSSRAWTTMDEVSPSSQTSVRNAYAERPLGALDRMLAGVIVGLLVDYEPDSLFVTDFKYSNFGTK